MRTLFIAVMLIAFSGSSLAAGFPDGNFPGEDALSPSPDPGGLDWEAEGWGEGFTEEWKEDGFGREEPVDPQAEPPLSAGPVKGFRLQGRIGGILPFLSQRADYAGGFAFGFGGKIGLKGAWVGWLRPSIDLGFISAEEDYWESSSTVALAHFDVGRDFLDSRGMRASAFLCLGAGIEFFSGERLAVAGGEKISDVNMNALGGLGGSFGIALAERLDIDFSLRLTFPVGGRNIQGIMLIGVSAAYAF